MEESKSRRKGTDPTESGRATRGDALGEGATLCARTPSVSPRKGGVEGMASRSNSGARHEMNGSLSHSSSSSRSARKKLELSLLRTPPSFRERIRSQPSKNKIFSPGADVRKKKESVPSSSSPSQRSSSLAPTDTSDSCDAPPSRPLLPLHTLTSPLSSSSPSSRPSLPLNGSSSRRRHFDLSVIEREPEGLLTHKRRGRPCKKVGAVGHRSVDLKDSTNVQKDELSQRILQKLKTNRCTSPKKAGKSDVATACEEGTSVDGSSKDEEMPEKEEESSERTLRKRPKKSEVEKRRKGKRRKVAVEEEEKGEGEEDSDDESSSGSDAHTVEDDVNVTFDKGHFPVPKPVKLTSLQKELKEEMISMYEVLYQRYAVYVELQGLPVWKKNYREVMKTRKEEVFASMEWKAPNFHGYFNDLKFNDKEIETISGYPALPSMYSFVHLNRSIKAENVEQLTHVPYMDEEADPVFLRELFSDYTGGIRGTVRPYSRLMTPRMQFELLEAMFNIHDEKTEEMSTNVFRVFYHLFPNSGTLKQLPARYETLRERYEKEKRLPHPLKRAYKEENDALDEQGLRNTERTPSEEDSERSGKKKEGGEKAGELCLRCDRCCCDEHVEETAIPPAMIVEEPCVAPGVGADNTDSDVEVDALAQTCSFLCHKDFQQRMQRQQQYWDEVDASPSTSAIDLSKVKHEGEASKKRKHQDKRKPPSDWMKPRTDFPCLMEAECLDILKLAVEAHRDMCSTARMMAALCGEGEEAPECYQLHTFVREHNFWKCAVGPKLERQTYKKKDSIRKKWRKFAMKNQSDNNGVLKTVPHIGCAHEGECGPLNADCRCATVKNSCTLHCGCALTCPLRFPGCSCAPGQCRTKTCQCYHALYECDPQICHSCGCGAAQIEGAKRCKNVQFQRGWRKKLVVEPSQLAGWGVYMDEDAEEGELVTEYVGEMITQDEADRRGIVYDKEGISYLFNLNSECTMDATRVGNVSRFINHSRQPNLLPRVAIVQGDHRIGLFAKRKILRGEELFFDYRYNNEEDGKLWGHVDEQEQTVSSSEEEEISSSDEEEEEGEGSVQKEEKVASLPHSPLKNGKEKKLEVKKPRRNCEEGGVSKRKKSDLPSSSANKTPQKRMCVK